MANYDLEAKITADASGYEAGVKKAEKASKKLSTSVSKVIQGLGKNGLVGALGAVGLASQGLTATLGAVVKIARRVSETMNECTNAYKTQLIAERSLNTAINNNPFVTGESSKALLQFASDMQKVTNYGDDELIPMMTNLISLGRTEAETTQIMSVAMDMSAGMGISLDSAITQLNATLNGSIGRLGQQNAELKGLTEEELEQGKAIEILGEKFKGLSSATVDTSKQLQNMKGDFKEALGEFTLPSNDLWNKFWTGFYERGIEVIGKFNSYLDAQITGKNLAKNLEEQLSKLSYTGDRIRYMRDAFGVISDSELNALDDYLSGLMNLNEVQKQLLERVQLEKQRRIDIAEIEKQMAEESAKRKKSQEKEEENDIAKLKQKHLDAIKQKEAEWKYTEEITEQEIDLNDKLSFYQQDLISIMTEGAGLITKDNEYYKQQIALINKIKKELKEKNKTQEESTETETEVVGFWDRILEKIKEFIKYLKENWKSVIKTMISATLQFGVVVASKMKEVISKVFSTIKGIFKSGVSLFSSLFNFNPDDALDMILKAEDNILTFFVETLPKMKGFFSSVIQSIVVLINNLVATIDWEFITEMVLDIIQNIRQNVPQILTGLITIFKELVKTFASIVTQFISSGGWKDLLNLVLTIQKELEKAVTDNIDEIADAIIAMLPDLVETLVQSIVSASQTLGKLAKTLLPLIAKIITAIIDVITDNRVIESSTEAIEEIVEALVPAIVELAVRAIPKIITMILVKLPSHTPNLIMGIVKGLADGFAKVNWGEALKGLWNGLVDFFSGIWDAIVNLFVDKIGGGFKKAFEQNDSTQTGSIAGDVGLGILTGGVSTIGHWLHWWADGTQNAPSGLSVVGESGPELVRFRGGEQVINARNTQKLLADTNGNTNNFNVTFNNLNDTSAYAMMNQLKQYNRQMAINGIL